jgi:hypothetical protein
LSVWGLLLLVGVVVVGILLPLAGGLVLRAVIVFSSEAQ